MNARPSKLLCLMLIVALLLSACAGGGKASVQSTTQPGSAPAVPPPVTEPSATEPTQTEPPVPPPVVTQITMTFVGDCTFGRNQKANYYNSFDDYYDQKGPDYFLSRVRHIFQEDDITVINLEGSLTTSTDIQDKMWNHKGDPEYVKIMTGSSVEVATMGNNHRLDYGPSGCEETVEVLEEAGITYCYDGIYATYEVDGIKVGFVSVNEVYDGRKVEKWLAEGYQSLRDQGCAIVIACVHWGGDKTPVIESYQIELGHKLVDMGYDLVVGNHPHVLQAMEVYHGKLICYSLGNFCYGGSKNPADKDSGIFQKTFTLVDGVLVTDLEAQFIPCYLSGSKSKNDFRPTLAEGEEFRRIIEKVNGYSERFGFELDSDGKPLLPENE